MGNEWRKVNWISTLAWVINMATLFLFFFVLRREILRWEIENYCVGFIITSDVTERYGHDLESSYHLDHEAP